MPREHNPDDVPTTYQRVRVTDLPGVPGFRPDQSSRIIDVAFVQHFDDNENGGGSGDPR